MIRLVEIQKKYGDRMVLDIPALSFVPGGRYALLGPNGSGKSTLLRIISGVIRPDVGMVTCDVPDKEIGYLPQTPYAFDLSVLKNVMVAADQVRTAKQSALAALRCVGMEALADLRGNRLSGGETQRMALARMMVKRHSVLLLDEPTSAVDIRAGEQIERALLAYADQTNCTLIFSSHAPSQALRLGAAVVMLDCGRVVETGTAADVLHHPRSACTRAFLDHWRI
ncbi:MAG: ABC transporter ATP-binding protein [Clostridia bacterium]